MSLLPPLTLDPHVSYEGPGKKHRHFQQILIGNPSSSPFRENLTLPSFVQSIPFLVPLPPARRKRGTREVLLTRRHIHRPGKEEGGFELLLNPHAFRSQYRYCMLSLD